MPGRFYLTRPITEVAAISGIDCAAVSGEPPRHNISPGQEIVALAPGGGTYMRWGIVPVGRVNARGRPVMETIVNARSESLFEKSAFAGTGRAIVPADGWYEWTGKVRHKQAWRIRPMDGALLGFAAITDTWTAPNGQQLPQVATVTCEPNADVRDVHHRMGVLLPPELWQDWLTGNQRVAKALLHPPAAGQLVVGPADDVDFSAR